ncbi:hypothetical protein AAG570_013773 [Ranatra chinensis]|uniref:Uncharacterized protein n=1 Tax=Ranatra chinensis TaxID=642074 RepID=A0ABD0YF32_9HEMI
MPFISKDWRSPGEEWVKTEEGWEKRKVLECGGLVRYRCISLMSNPIIRRRGGEVALEEDMGQCWGLGPPAAHLWKCDPQVLCIPPGGSLYLTLSCCCSKCLRLPGLTKFHTSNSCTSEQEILTNKTSARQWVVNVNKKPPLLEIVL